MDAAAFEQVYGSFRDFHAYFAPLFGRRETREHSGHYLQALLVQSGERRNAENLSETVPGSARGMQRFLTDSPWDDEVIIGRLQEYLGTRLEHPEGVWVLDGSDFPKQGRKSVGVARQYCGRLGKVANCQAGMFLAYVSPLGRALVDKGLYLPESWTSDKDRCEAAGVPEDRQGYRSKTELALEMVGRAQERGHLKAGWVAADDAFGMSPSFREGLAALGMWYVLDVPSGFTVWPPEPAWTSAEYQGFGRPRKPRLRDGQRRTMEQRSDELPEEAWREITVAEGSQGPRSYLFSAQRVRPDQQAQARRNPLGRLPPEPGRQLTPLLPVQCSGGYPVGDPGIRGRLPLAYRNGVRDREKRRRPGRVRDPHLGWLASPRGPVPAGRSFSAEPATGLGGKRCPGSRGRRSTGWCGKCCPGNGSGQPSCCGGLRIRRTVTNGPNAPMPSAAPPCGHHPTSLPELTL